MPVYYLLQSVLLSSIQSAALYVMLKGVHAKQQQNEY